MQLIDTHVHINFDVFKDELNLLRNRWQEAGVVHLVHSCVEPKEFESIKALAERFDEISFAVGLHPLDAEKWTPETAQEIKKLAQSDEKVVAIGETGLDFYKADNHQLQKKVLTSQLEIAQELELPVIIHCREAATALKEIIQAKARSKPIAGVMHCWGGTPEETKWFLDLGLYISFSGVVTFKKATQIQESALIVPSDRLLIETDCPFLAPVPVRGKRNEPANVRYVAEYLARLRNVSQETLAQETTENAQKLFRLKIK